MDEHITEMSVIRGALSSMENRTLTVSSGVPAFLAKLWKLVEDSSSDHLISWSPVSFYMASVLSLRQYGFPILCDCVLRRHAYRYLDYNLLIVHVLRVIFVG